MGSPPKQETSIGPPPRRPPEAARRPGPAQTGVTQPPPSAPQVIVPPPPFSRPAVEPLPSPAAAAPMPAAPFVRPATVKVAAVPLAPEVVPTRVQPSAETAGTHGGGPLSADARPTTVESPVPHDEYTDRGAGGWHRGPDTADAPQMGTSMPTMVGIPRRATPAWLLFAAPALSVGLVGSAAVWTMHAGPVEPRPAPAAAADDVEPALRWLADVNATEPARILPFAARHERLQRLQSSPRAAFVDRRLNLALDLAQAGTSPDPCAVYGAALDEITATADPYFVRPLQQYPPPMAGGSACPGLAQQRDAARTALGAASAKAGGGDGSGPEAETPEHGLPLGG